MTVDLQAPPSDGPEEFPPFPRVESPEDDRFAVAPWLPRFLDRGPHRLWLRLAESPSGPTVWRVFLPLNLVLFFVLHRLNTALTVLHPPGADGYGIRALSRTSPGPEMVLHQWKEAVATLKQPGAEVLRKGVTEVTLPTAHALVAALFSVAWPTALALAAVWVGRRLATVDRSPRAEAAKAMLGVALYSVPFTIGVGLLQNVARFLVVHDQLEATAASVLRGTTALLAVLILTGVVPILVGLALLQSSPGAKVRGFFRGLGLVRMQLITVGAFAVLLLAVSTKDQAQDVLRTWQTHPSWAVWGVLAVILFAATTGVSAARVLAMSRNRRRAPHHPASLIGVGVVLVIVGAALQLGFKVGGLGLVIAGAGMAVIGLLSWFIQGPGTRQAETSTPVRPTLHSPAGGDDEVATWPALAGLLAAAPLAVVGLATVAALVPEFLGTGKRPVLLTVVAVLLFILTIPAYRLSQAHVHIPPPDSEAKILTGRLVKVVVAPATVAAVGLAISIWRNPWEAGEKAGTIALVGFFLAGLMVVAMLVAAVTHRYSPPAALAILGFRRIPVLLLLIIWGVAGVTVDGNSPLHDARVMVTNDAVRPVADFGRYTNRWISDQTAQAIPSPTGRSRASAPLVLVSAAGGGIKAATWTALVVHCALDPVVGKECPATEARRQPIDGWPSVYAVSGASGGSVGLASALAEHLGDAHDTDWVARRLGSDLASASIGWQLFEEAPLALLRVRPGKRDRAEVLEEAWSHRWAGVSAECGTPHATDPTQQGMFALFGEDGRSACGPVPLFFPNGTSLVDGCRFNGSVLDTAPPPGRDKQPLECGRSDVAASPDQPTLAVTRDLTDFLCADEDVRLSTAAFLSARFPFVSPTGRLTGPARRGRGDDDHCLNVPEPKGMVFVGDGGYRDNTGSSTLLELWERLRPAVEAQKGQGGPCLVPIFVQINSGYENRSAPRTSGRLFETTGPLTGGLSVFGTRDAAGPQLAQSRFSPYYFSFSLRAHPAVQAPLGWSLSTSATRDIKRQLKFKDQQKQLNDLQKLLQGENLTCPGG